METKCPICGAPLADGKCGYCGYVIRKMKQENENIYSGFEQNETEQCKQEDVIGDLMFNNMGIVPGISRTSSNVQSKSKVEQLRELKELLDDGILTQEEFDTEKKRILGN